MLVPADEAPHELADAGPSACDVWTFEFATPDAALAGWVRYVRFADHAWYVAHLVGEHRRPMGVVDLAVPLRSSAREVRTTGLWADHVCETPFDHWTVGLEAFAVQVDDPGELIGEARGDLVPFGLDVEWEAAAAPVPAQQRWNADRAAIEPTEVDGYVVPATVHGEVLIGAEEVDLDALGTWSHWWGPIDWAGPTFTSGGIDGFALALDGDRWWVRRSGGNGAVDEVVGGPHPLGDRPNLSRNLQHRPDGLPASIRFDAPVSIDVPGGSMAVIEFGEAGSPPTPTSIDTTVVAVTPVTLPVPSQIGEADGWRALCRLRFPDGTAALGWVESIGAWPDGLGPAGPRA